MWGQTMEPTFVHSPVVLLAAILVFSSAIGLAQTKAQPAAGAGSALVPILEQAAAQDLVLRGRATVDEPAADGAGTMVVTVGGASQPEFQGELEVLRDKRGELLVASTRVVPGIVVHDLDGTQLIQTLHADEAVGAEVTASDLSALCDLGRLARALARQEIRVDSSKDGTTYRTKLPKGYLRSAGGPVQMLQPKVLSIDVTIRVDGKQQLSGLVFSVMRTDPTAAMRERAMGGGGAIELDAGSELPEHEGATRVYDLKVAAAASERARAALADMRRAATEAGR